MFGVSKLVAMVLSFALGFSCCIGVLVGGFAIAAGSFRVRDLEKHEIVDIPDEIFMGENPDVDLLNLSLIEMIDEMKEIYSMGDALTIDVLQKRYDLKIPAAANKFLNDEARAMPIKSLFSEAGIKALLSTMYIGTVQSFECHKLDSAEPGDPTLGKDGARWFNPTTGEYVTGLNETLAFISLGDFVSGKVDVTAVIGGLHIGEALGYYSVIDEATGDEYWCDGTTGERVTGIMGVFAGCTVDEVGDKINDAKIGDLLGYVKNDSDVWCEKDEEGNLIPVDGLMKVLAGSSMDTIGDDINGAKLGDLLEYTERDDGVWCEMDAEGNLVPVSGLMKTLADSTMDTVGDNIEVAKLGDLFGYYYDETDARWEDDETSNTPITGFMKILADSTMDTVGDNIEVAKLGDLLGYEYDEENEVWKDADTHENVTGFMKILANSTMDNVGDEIENAYLGDLFGYYQKVENGPWYEIDENGNEVEVDGFNNKIANEKLDTIGNAFDNLLISDIVAEDKREGIFAILDPETPINNISGAINDSIMKSPLQFFMNEGLVNFDDQTQRTLDEITKLKDEYILVDASHYDEYYKDQGIGTLEGDKYKIPAWRDQQLSDSFGYIVTLLTSQ